MNDDTLDQIRKIFGGEIPVAPMSAGKLAGFRENILSAMREMSAAFKRAAAVNPPLQHMTATSLIIRSATNEWLTGSKDPLPGGILFAAHEIVRQTGNERMLAAILAAGAIVMELSVLEVATQQEPGEKKRANN